MTKSLKRPETVHVFKHSKPETFHLKDLRVALHGQSFADRDVTDNLAAGYPDPVSGWFNIGVLHTAADGRDGHTPYAPCSVAELKAKGL